MLIDAWSIVAKAYPDWKLKIVGPGERGPYQEQVKQLGLEQCVSCKDASDHIFDEMASSSFYVLSSRSEGFGLVLIEAMAVGLPCVAFSCSAGPRSIITDQLDGILVPKNNVQELADAISFMIVHDKERQKYAANAKINAERYRVDNIMMKWIILFENIMGI